MIVSSCDFCEEENIIVRELYDQWGDHIMNECYYGCGNVQNIPNEPKEELKVDAVEKVDTIECYSTEWLIKLIVNQQTWATKITRLNGETESKLVERINKCKNTAEVERLNIDVVHN